MVTSTALFGAGRGRAKHVKIKKNYHEMAGYGLYTVVPKLVKFINNLTNWYEQEKIEKKKEGKLIAGLHWKLCSEWC